MIFDTKKLQWTRLPADYTIAKDKIEMITKPTPICGSAPTITFEMTMHPYCR